MPARLGSCVLLLLAAALLGGCSSIAGSTNMLSDERLVAEAAGALGKAPADLKLLSRQTSGTNTYAVLRGKDGKEHSCTINGGNLLSFGMVNPPSCQPR
ncbi:hypothetical protein G8A07_01145 [Roseateles sp. DAIF2]|uniref:hypothetical protein n=1 Tax=Roseateles sp. DAIF2 TaxID=2714952 RepID=UPI0018A298DB|nr:hypothetical protein [Roseateles sp. DAIF2]QPF71668.1 hypothetical protein G8A07_01145 [Roseateles sp. DAIF2]